MYFPKKDAKANHLTVMSCISRDTHEYTNLCVRDVLLEKLIIRMEQGLFSLSSGEVPVILQTRENWKKPLPYNTVAVF